MSRTIFISSLLLSTIVLALVAAGCGRSTAEGPQVTPAAQSRDVGTASAESSAHAKNLAKLSPQDRRLAEKQKVCPVTDEPLGSMGVPVKVTVKGRTVFLCCAGCEDELKSEPDKYLEKLDHPKAK